MAIIQPVILSGGSGSRLWPASRSMYPKQLLPLTSGRTMLQDTIGRLAGRSDLTPSPIVVCNESHRFLVAQQLEEIGVQADIILEPEGRNTAPAIALAALHALRGEETAADSATLLILPADHVIADERNFYAAMDRAIAATDSGGLVTFGIVPTEPNIGYGYIEADPGTSAAVRVQSFVEKPGLDVARAYVQGGKHFWNSGMFLFRTNQFLTELGRHAPEIATACRAAMEGAQTDTDFIRPDRDAFLGCPADSIDYAVMEKTDKAMMVSLDAGWSDVGSWSAVHDVSAKDSQGNVSQGDSILHSCRDSFVSSESRLVAAVGISDLIVVETKDAVLVVNRDKSQEVKQLVEELKASGRDETSLHRQVYRPWGSYDSLENEDGFQVKHLIVNPGAVLSLQKHRHRAEHWVVVRGTATITLNDEIFELGVNESTHIPIGAIHRIANQGNEPVHIIEVQCGDYLGEDDIVRLEDNYGREGTNT